MLKKICIATSLVASLYSSSALADPNKTPDYYLRGMEMLIDQIDVPIEIALKRAEELYASESNNGRVNLSANQNELDTTANKTNVVLEKLTINKSYSAYVKLATIGATTTINDVTGAMPEQVGGARFLFSGVKNAGDTNINSWTCMTDIDSKLVNYQGENDAPTQNKYSVLTTTSKVPALRSCTYIGPDTDGSVLKEDAAT